MGAVCSVLGIIAIVSVLRGIRFYICSSCIYPVYRRSDVPWRSLLAETMVASYDQNDGYGDKSHFLQPQSNQAASMKIVDFR